MSSPLKERLQDDLILARKARDKARIMVLSMTLSEVRNREIETGHDASDEDLLQVLGRAIKQRRDAARQMGDAGRPELAEREAAEAEMLGHYLPEPLSEAEVRSLIEEITADGQTAIGAVMGQLMPRIRGRFDGKEANRIAREVLAP